MNYERIDPSMETLSNRFGQAPVLIPQSLPTPIYIECAACLSVFSEWWEWAEEHRGSVTKNPVDAASILVLGCQVTDLAVLNDLRTAERLAAAYPEATVYMGGCLARRLDIPLSYGRVILADDGRVTAGPLRDRALVHWQDPFWIRNFHGDTSSQGHGNQFRHDYPIRIGRGCKGKCAFCTINTTRGSCREYALSRETVRQHPYAVLVGDSPTVEQVEEALTMALETRSPIGLRNLEPDVATRTAALATQAARRGAVWAWHCPIQSTNMSVVRKMRRDPVATEAAMALARALSDAGVWTATNVIWDFVPGDRSETAAHYFRHVAWNPYWDGQWDRARAERRWQEYLGEPSEVTQ